MKKRRWMKYMSVISLAGLALLATLLMNAQVLAPSAPQTPPAIQGETIADSKEVDTTEEKKEEQAVSVPDEKKEETSNAEPPPTGLVQVEQAASGVNQAKIQELQTKLENLIHTEYQAGGKAAVCAGKANENDMAIINSAPMQAASLIKLYVAGCVYENYDAVGKQDSYNGETAALLSEMITVSDNTACNTLVTRLGAGDAQKGMDLVNAYCTNHGFPDTHMGRLMLQPNTIDDNYTSASDCCKYLKMIYANQLEGSFDIRNYLNKQERRGKIPAGIPSDITVGNKTGELSDVENDAAIVYSPNGVYVLCVMSEDLADTYEARQFIIKLSKATYEAMQ